MCSFRSCFVLRPRRSRSLFAGARLIAPSLAHSCRGTYIVPFLPFATRANLDASTHLQTVIPSGAGSERQPTRSRNPSSTSVFLRRNRLRLAAYHAEPNILRRRRTIRLRIRRTIRATANHFAFAVARQDPLGHIAAKIINRLFVILGPTMKASDLLQQWRPPIQLLGRFTQLRRILRIRRIPRPVVQRILTLAMFVQLFYFVFVRNPPCLPGLFAKPCRVSLSFGE